MFAYAFYVSDDYERLFKNYSQQLTRLNEVNTEIQNGAGDTEELQATKRAIEHELFCSRCLILGVTPASNIRRGYTIPDFGTLTAEDISMDYRKFDHYHTRYCLEYHASKETEEDYHQYDITNCILKVAKPCWNEGEEPPVFNIGTSKSIIYRLNGSKTKFTVFNKLVPNASDEFKGHYPIYPHDPFAKKLEGLKVGDVLRYSMHGEDFVLEILSIQN